MKHRVHLWTLSWDTRAGTDCAVFGTEEEWFQYFRRIIESSIADIEAAEAVKIRSVIETDIGLAYELWIESYKPELDTYNWDELDINVEIQN
ncbi:MAG: hypothetical protein WCS43_14190 [Verrucomicrobiota bacterium]